MEIAKEGVKERRGWGMKEAASLIRMDPLFQSVVAYV